MPGTLTRTPRTIAAGSVSHLLKPPHPFFRGLRGLEINRGVVLILNAQCQRSDAGSRPLPVGFLKNRGLDCVNRSMRADGRVSDRDPSGCANYQWAPPLPRKRQAQAIHRRFARRRLAQAKGFRQIGPGPGLHGL